MLSISAFYLGLYFKYFQKSIQSTPCEQKDIEQP